MLLEPTAPFDFSFIHVLIASTLSLVVGCYPLYHRRTRITKIFAAANISLTVMALGDGVGFLPVSHDMRLFLYRVTYPLTISGILGYVWFMVEMSGTPLPHYKFTLKCLAWLGVLLSGLSFTPWICA